MKKKIQKGDTWSVMFCYKADTETEEKKDDVITFE